MENSTKKVLFSLVRTKIHGGTISKAEVEDIISSGNLEELYKLAKEHDVAHLIGSLTDEAWGECENEIIRKFKKQYYAAIYRYRGMEYELARLSEVFTEAKIPHIALKGSVIRGYYPEPWMRTSCDVDVLVEKENLERAEKILEEKLGYKITHDCSHDVSLNSESGVHLELHFTLIEKSDNQKIVDILSDVWNTAAVRLGDGYRYELNDEVFYFYHIAHMLKHFLDGGCGLRSFIDLWILDNRCEYDASARDALLESAGVLKFADCSRTLSKIIMDGAESNEFYDKFADYVIKVGLYCKTHTKVYVQRGRGKSRFSYAMSRIFLPYSSMKFIFPILNRRKWLTPVYEVVRWFKILFGGRVHKGVNELHANSKVDAKAVANANSMLKELGIK